MLTLSDVIIPTGLANSKCRPFFIFTPLQAIMQTDAAEQQEQIAALQDFAATSLAELERRLAEDKQAQIAALERFATTSDLKTLREMAEEQRTEFDAIDFLRLSNDEEFHSNFLDWLLGPNNNHGIGDYFLKKFLRRVGLSFEVIESVDWTPAESQREWRNIADGQPGYLDILIVNETKGFLCAIENKIWYSEHSEQLTRYRKALEERYPDYDRHYVFLSRWGAPPYREEEQECWKPMNYATILELVEQTIDDTDVREDVRAFLRQYATTLRRKIVPDSNTNIQQLVREIYLKHREAIQLIKDHEPDWISETVQILKEAVAKQSNWILDLTDDKHVRFRSANWDLFEAMQTGTRWAPRSNALLLFEFTFVNDEPPYLDLGLSTGDETNNSVRARLFEQIRQHPQLFRPKHASLPDSWAILHEEEECILEDADYGIGWDDGSTRAKIEAWVSNFAEHQFPAMNEVIVKCLEEYEAEQA